MTTPHEILIAAKALIPDEEHWWRGNVDNHQIEHYCPVTALSWAGRDAPSQNYALAVSALVKVINNRDVIDWNDSPHRTLADIHAAFDRAIEATRP